MNLFLLTDLEGIAGVLDIEFIESHMGAHDSDIEAVILYYCIKTENAKWNTVYKVCKVLPRQKNSPYTIKINGEIIHRGRYIKKYVRDNVYSFTDVGE